MNEIQIRKGKGGHSLALAFALLLLVVPGLRADGAEGDTNNFKFVKLEFPGTRHDRLLADVNGDGLLDLNMIYTRSDRVETFFFRTCLQDKAGFNGKCAEFTLPREARAFDIGEVDGLPGAEMIVITQSAVTMTTFAGGKFGAFGKVLADRNIFAGTDEGRPSLLRCLWDVNGDRKRELVLSTLDGPVIYTHKDNGFTVFQRVKSPAHVTYRVGSLGDILANDDVNQFLSYRVYQKRTTASYTVPDVFIEDFNGDRKPDLITLVDNTLRVFAQGEDGKFSDKPVATVKRPILDPKEKVSGLAGEAMTFADLNGDGLGDIIMMKWGTSDERTQMDRYIYFAKPGLKYPEKPDQIIRSESVAVDFGMHDLNRDKKVDLVIPFFHFAPAQAFKVMTENAVKVQFRIFIMQPNGKYSQDQGKTFAKVDRRVLLNYKVDVLGFIFDFRTLIEGRFHPLINFGYDFNGDGYRDIIADTGGDKLTFYWGNAQVNYSATPNLTIDYESCMDYDLADINGDGKTDVITYYDSEARTKKKREIAKKAREQGAASAPTEVEESALAAVPEGTRVKALISR